MTACYNRRRLLLAAEDRDNCLGRITGPTQVNLTTSSHKSSRYNRDSNLSSEGDMGSEMLHIIQITDFRFSYIKMPCFVFIRCIVNSFYIKKKNNPLYVIVYYINLLTYVLCYCLLY